MPWMDEEPYFVPCAGLAAATCDAPAQEFGQWIYAVGGYDVPNTTSVATVGGYDPIQEQWFARTPMPNPRWGLAAASSPGALHALGGYDNTGTPVTAHEVYEPAND